METLPLLKLIEQAARDQEARRIYNLTPLELREAGWELCCDNNLFFAWHAAEQITTESYHRLADCLRETYDYSYLLELLPAPALLQIEQTFPAAPMLPARFQRLVNNLSRR